MDSLEAIVQRLVDRVGWRDVVKNNLLSVIDQIKKAPYEHAAEDLLNLELNFDKMPGSQQEGFAQMYVLTNYNNWLYLQSKTWNKSDSCNQALALALFGHIHAEYFVKHEETFLPVETRITNKNCTIVSRTYGHAGTNILYISRGSQARHRFKLRQQAVAYFKRSIKIDLLAGNINPRAHARLGEAYISLSFLERDNWRQLQALAVEEYNKFLEFIPDETAYFRYRVKPNHIACAAYDYVIAAKSGSLNGSTSEHLSKAKELFERALGMGEINPRFRKMYDWLIQLSEQKAPISTDSI